jgi:hypothetical protein
MPDNVSLTVSEINQMKQTANSLIGKLKDIRFYFQTDKSSATKNSIKSLPIISDNEGGLVIYAGRDTLKLTKAKGNSLVFTLPTMNFAATPVIQVTLTAENDKSKYLLSTTAHYAPGKITVYVSSSNAPGITKYGPSVMVNVLAIGYA